VVASEFFDSAMQCSWDLRQFFFTASPFTTHRTGLLLPSLIVAIQMDTLSFSTASSTIIPCGPRTIQQKAFHEMLGVHWLQYVTV